MPLPVALMIAGTAITAGGAILSSQASARAQRRNAATSQFNARANAADIRSISAANASAFNTIAQGNAQGLIRVAEFNASAVRNTAAHNAEMIRNSSVYNASVSLYNASINDQDAFTAGQNAIAAREQAQFDSRRIQEEGKRLFGEQVSAMSKSGTTLSGSNLDVIFDAAFNNEREALLAEYSGDLVAWSFFAQAIDFQNQAKYDEHTAEALYVQGQNESTFALWQGETEAQAILLNGYTNANIIIAEGQIRAATTMFEGERNALAMERSGSSLSAQLREGANITAQAGWFNAIGSGLSGAGAAAGMSTPATSGPRTPSSP